MRKLKARRKRKVGSVITPKEKRNKNFYGLHENYLFLRDKLSSELKIASDHHGITGSYRENAWLQLFRGIIPLKYSLEKNVKIIDSESKISRDVDIAVFDEQYTPYIFVYDSIKYIPIEAVAVAIQCKSTDYNPNEVKEWSDSVTKLTPKVTGIARMASGYTVGFTSPTQKRTRPILILATLKQGVKEETIEKRAADLEDYFDFIIFEQKAGDKYLLDVKLNYENQSLGWWGDWLNSGKKPERQDEGGLITQMVTVEYLKQHVQDLSNDNNRQDNLAENIANQEQFNETLKKRLMQLYPELEFPLLEQNKAEEDTKESNVEDNKDDNTKNNKINNVLITNTLEQLKVEGNPLLTLNLQLNQLLMLINNPMLFPHYAYAQAFTKALEFLKNQSSN